MHILFLVYFVNLYMFWVDIDPLSGGTTVCIQHLLHIIICRWLSVVLFGSIEDSHLKRIICTKCCIHTFVLPDDGPRYAQNLLRLTKYAKNKTCIKLVFLYTNISKCTVNKTLKKPVPSLVVARHTVNLAGSQCVTMQTGRRGTFSSALHLMTKFGGRTQIWSNASDIT